MEYLGRAQASPTLASSVEKNSLYRTSSVRSGTCSNYAEVTSSSYFVSSCVIR